MPVEHADEQTELAVTRAPWDTGSLSEEGATVLDPNMDTEDSSAEGPVVDEAPSVNPTNYFPIPNKPKNVITTGDLPPPAKAATAPDDAYLESNTMLGEYRIEAQIGEGGMGVVYAAVHPLIGKRAAIKVLKAELCRSAFNVERFIDEARIVNQIGHQNIVDVFAFGQTKDGRSYFVMEWLKGESLRARIARSRLDFSEICEIVRPLARALEAAHEHGVIHRDLKPDNIFLVDRRGDASLVKLLDFGIAKLAREEHRLERTATGAMVGTPQYIAPEQAKGYAIDHRVDIYALGGIVFELLTGHPPFQADNAMVMVAKHLMEAPPRPSSLADVPPELDDLVLRMLSKAPEGRPSLAEVASVIERTNALDRTNVKTPVPAHRALQGPSAAINVPTPTPVASARLRQSSPVFDRAGMSGALNPKLSEAVARAMATPGALSGSVAISDMTETIRSPRSSGISKQNIALLGIGFVVAAVIAYFVVSLLSVKDKKATTVPEVKAPVVQPIDPAPPKPEPSPPVTSVGATAPKELPEPPPKPAKGSNEPKHVEAGSMTPPLPKEAAVTNPPMPTKIVPTRVVPKDPTQPMPVKKKAGRLELQISGHKNPPRILVDGSPSGPGKELAPGVHTVQITSLGMKPQSFSVLIEDGKTYARRVLLEAEKPPPPKNPKDDLMVPGSLDPNKKDQ